MSKDSDAEGTSELHEMTAVLLPLKSVLTLKWVGMTFIYSIHLLSSRFTSFCSFKGTQWALPSTTFLTIKF